MNRLTDALKLAEGTPPGPVTHASDRPSDPAVPGGRQLDPIRVTRDNQIPGALSPATLDVTESSGKEAPHGWWLEPIRATRDDVSADADAAALAHDFAATKKSESARSALSDPPFEDVNANAAALDHEFAATESSASANAAFSDALSKSTGGQPSDDGLTPSATFRSVDSRTLPQTLARGRGIGRPIGTALLLLAVIASVVAGGYFIWNTEFVRPALVRRLPPVLEPVMDLVPVHTANAAVNDGGEPAEGAAPRTDGGPAVSSLVPEALSLVPGAPPPETTIGGFSASGAPEKPQGTSTLEASTSKDTARSRAVSTAGGSTLQRPLESRAIPASESAAPGQVEPEPEPARRDRQPALALSASSPGLTDRTRPGHRRNHVSASGEHAPEIAASVPEIRSSAPVVEPVAPAAVDASLYADASLDTGTPPDAGTLPGAVGNPLPATAHDGTEPRPDSGIVIRKRIRTDHVAALLERAYAAFLAGDGASAAQAYRSALGHEPGNRDAHLGLAAVAARAGRWDEAAGHYARILAFHPADTVARAALITIDEQDSARGESRLKTLLRGDPQAAHLHFNLGNLYAAQSRWPEAQQSYFNAHRFDRGNADYAYNLAVSLDHLSQPESALDLYREALALSRSRPASFEAATVRQRIRDLETHSEAEAALVRPASGAGVASARPASGSRVTPARPTSGSGVTPARPASRSGVTPAGPASRAEATPARSSSRAEVALTYPTSGTALGAPAVRIR